MWNPIEKITNTYNATVSELKKCTWPSWQELKESTVVVIVSVAIISVFVAGIDAAAGGLVSLVTGTLF